MVSIKDDLSVMPPTDPLQWMDLNRKTGAITATFQGTGKKIYEKKTGIGNNS